MRLDLLIISTCKHFLFAHDSYMGNLPSIFGNYFTLSSNQHNYFTRAASMKLISLPRKRTTIYGIRSITYQSALAWNNILKENEENFLSNKSKYFCKKSITKNLLDSY